MNWKLIIRAAFELDDEGWKEVLKLRAMSSAERELLLSLIGPQPRVTKRAGTAAGKKREYAKCAQCGETKRSSIHKDTSRNGYHEFEPKKSARASGMAEQLTTRRQERGAGTKDRDGSCVNCDYGPDHNIHHLESMAGYHPFTPAAQPAGRGSSRKDEDGGLEASSKTEQDEAGVAASAGD